MFFPVQRHACSLLIIIHTSCCLTAWCAGVLPPCPDTQPVLGIASDCAWLTPKHGTTAARVSSTTARVPLVLVNSTATTSGTAGSGPATGEFHVTLQRLLLVGVKLTDPASSEPQLWPLGLFDRVGTGLNISDVRLIVDGTDFQKYLSLLQTLPRAVAQYFTDGKSFLHIAAWEGRSTNAHSVTLISGGCLVTDAAAYADFAGTMLAAGQEGCNVRSVNNATLIPTLLTDGSLPTPQPLLVLVTANVSLGFGLKAGSIPINRPVVMAGLYSVPTSVDMYMVVNQLNVTSKYAKIYFLSLFIENAAPGDAISSLLSRPMSSAVSANVYAVYCDRMKNCLNLHNSTVVLASQQEMDYLNYMYSMFNSPLPNMRQATAFYHTELRCVTIQMGPGPNGIGMTLYNLTCGAWDLSVSVFTTQPAVAERLPFPEGAPQITAATRAGPLVQSVRDCSSLQEAMNYKTIETRLHVWMLLDSIDVVPDGNNQCWKNRNIRYPTQIYGRSHDSAKSENSPTAYTFAFGYLPDALVLPPSAEARFFSIFNTTLIELPQGPNPRAAATPGRLPPDALTLLLWSIGRDRASDAVYVHDVTMFLPQPEFQFFAERAAASSSFVVQLMGDDDLTFKGTMGGDGVVTVQSLDGPGLLGTNVVFRASSQLPPGYYWPASAAETIAVPQGSGLSVGEVVGIVLGSVGAVLLVLLAAFAAVTRRRRRHAQQQHAFLPGKPLYDTAPMASNSSGCPSFTNPGSATGSQYSTGKSVHAAVADAVGVDIAGTRDLLSPLPVVVQNTSGRSGDSKPSAPTSASAAAASSGTNGSALAGSLPSGGPSSSAAHSSSSDSISLGLDRWKAAISTTTMQLMERRMQMAATSLSTSSASVRTPSNSSSKRLGGLASGSVRSQLSCGGSGNVAVQQHSTGLQIHQLIGQGSFGSVWLGTWHGKRVACKIMQLPASGPFANQEDRAPAALMAQNQANSPPHMAIMEAVLSSTVSHPNVVQVYTYMLNSLGVGGSNGDSDGHRVPGPPKHLPDAAAAAAAAVAGVGSPDGKAPGAKPPYSKITGWELKLVMEYCNAGTLREALDRRILHGEGVKYLPRESILSLCHDVAAALLHLHSQGVVHGDLKAANVMLTQGGDDQGGVWAAAYGHKVTAKVADFGLALPLDPSDTHATLAARGTPTHMSPELFMSGHVSKASDIYALGILLHELITGYRAYAGVPIPLLPHEVAVKGLRPKWPSELPEEYRELQALAEACWQQRPQERPTITDIFDWIGLMVQGKPIAHLLTRSQLPEDAQEVLQQQQQSQQQDGKTQQQDGGMQQQQQQQQQQSDLRAGGPREPSPAGPSAGRKNMSWSEVTYVSPP